MKAPKVVRLFGGSGFVVVNISGKRGWEITRQGRHWSTWPVRLSPEGWVPTRRSGNYPEFRLASEAVAWAKAKLAK